MRQQILAGDASIKAFVMLNARLVDQEAAKDDDQGYYDPETQTWVGSIHAQSSTYSTHRTAGGANVGDQTHRRDD